MWGGLKPSRNKSENSNSLSVALLLPSTSTIEFKKGMVIREYSGPIHPYFRYEKGWKTSKTMSAIATSWHDKAMFEKRAAMVEVDMFHSFA